MPNVSLVALRIENTVVDKYVKPHDQFKALNAKQTQLISVNINSVVGDRESSVLAVINRAQTSLATKIWKIYRSLFYGHHIDCCNLGAIGIR